MKQTRIPFSAFLLTAILSGFCAGSVLETAEGESTASELEEVIASRRQDERLSNRSVDVSSFSYLSAKREGATLQSKRPKWVSGGHASEHSARNGIGGPLAL